MDNGQRQLLQLIWRLLLLLYFCCTTAVLLLYYCFTVTTTAADMEAAITALLLLYYCCTTALLLLYYCCTTALLLQLGKGAIEREAKLRETLKSERAAKSAADDALAAAAQRLGILDVLLLYYCFTTADLQLYYYGAAALPLVSLAKETTQRHRKTRGDMDWVFNCEGWSNCPNTKFVTSSDSYHAHQIPIWNLRGILPEAQRDTETLKHRDRHTDAGIIPVRCAADYARTHTHTHTFHQVSWKARTNRYISRLSRKSRRW